MRMQECLEEHHENREGKKMYGKATNSIKVQIKKDMHIKGEIGEERPRMEKSSGIKDYFSRLLKDKTSGLSSL